MNETKIQKPCRGDLSEAFRQKLESDTTGGLKGLVDYVRKDQELDMQFRDNYINIYYNGGCALEVRPMSMNLDQYYFYLYENVNTPKDVPESTIIGNFRKTYIEEWRTNSPRDVSDRPEGYPQREAADAISKVIENKRNCLIDLIKRDKSNEADFEAYFTEVKKAIAAWVENYKHVERRDQHYIACSNRGFTDKNDLVVIDIEFAVSTKKSYNSTKDSKHPKGKVPKFDIIAVDENGQLYAIELKANLAADKDDSEQNVKGHQKDFDNTIGGHCDENDFIEEMRKVLELKKHLHLIDETATITCKYPIFAVAFSGEDGEKEEFNKRYKNVIEIVDIVRESDKKLYLKLK
jgi:hypothetical protein